MIAMSYGTKFFRKSGDYKPLYSSLINKVGKEKASKLFATAGRELDSIMEAFPNVPKGERNHTDKYIFPRAALYRVLKNELGADAMKMIDEAVNVQGEKVGKMLKKLTSLPLMEKAFLKIFSLMAKNMFGEKNGFSQRSYPAQKGRVKFDILDCTYCRYCRELNCPELIHTFCQTDFYCFGNLSKITFTREQTLEHGEKCDFTLSIQNSK